MSDSWTNGDTLLPYYFADFPSFSEWSPDPRDPLRSKRKCYWSADCLGSTIAGHAHARARDVRRWLKGCGCKEVFVTYDAQHVAGAVAILRRAFVDGRRARMARGDLVA